MIILCFTVVNPVLKAKLVPGQSIPFYSPTEREWAGCFKNTRGAAQHCGIRTPPVDPVGEDLLPKVTACS